jgi:hypothetical protein
MSERLIVDFFKRMKRDAEYEAFYEFETCMTPILRCRNRFSGQLSAATILLRHKPFLPGLMAFFGYMEGALRSGERAAHALIRKACGLMQERVPAPVMRTVRATPIRKEIA